MSMKWFVVIAFCFASIASAGTLVSNLTVDNAFYLYISTSDATLGTLAGSGTNWGVTYSLDPTLTNGTNYIHVVAVNQGGPGGFLGDFTLDDANFQFANATQHLLTNTADWKFSATGFGGTYGASTDEGANGVGPWGTLSGINSSARWLWDPGNCGDCTVYFSAPIYYTDSQTPEPASFFMLGGGLVLAGLLRRNRRSH